MRFAAGALFALDLALPLYKGSVCKDTRKACENFLAPNSSGRKRNWTLASVRHLLRCENITAAIQVKRNHILVILRKEFWITSAHMQLHESQDRRLVR